MTEYNYIDDTTHLGDNPETDDWVPPLEVVNVGPTRHSPEVCNPVTYSIAQNQTVVVPTQLLQRSTRRHKARINIDALAGGATSVIFNSRPDSLTGPNPQGGTIVAVPRQIVWENQQPLYACAIGGGPVIATVQDEQYALTDSEEQ
jgi:hypothetical protein